MGDRLKNEFKPMARLQLQVSLPGRDTGQIYTRHFRFRTVFTFRRSAIDAVWLLADIRLLQPLQ
jgi:hypothetical protein